MQRLATVGVAAALTAGAIAVAAGPASAAGRERVFQAKTVETLEQSFFGSGQLNSFGGGHLAGTGLVKLRANYSWDLSGLQCSLDEIRDVVVLVDLQGNQIRLVATGGQQSRDDCAGRRFGRTLDWRVLDGTGKYAGATGHGTAHGAGLTDPAKQFETVTTYWTGSITF